MSGVDLRGGYYGTEREGSGSARETRRSRRTCGAIVCFCGAIWRGLGEHPCPGKVAPPSLPAPPY